MFHSLRRGGRVVECGGLENRLPGVPGYEGSNPSSSASLFSQRALCGSFFFMDRKDSVQQTPRCCTACCSNGSLRQPLAVAKGGARRQQAAPRPHGYRAGTLLEPNSIKQPQRAPRARTQHARPLAAAALSRYAFPTSTVSRRGQVVTCRLRGIWSSVSHISAGKV